MHCKCQGATEEQGQSQKGGGEHRFIHLKTLVVAHGVLVLLGSEESEESSNEGGSQAPTSCRTPGKSLHRSGSVSSLVNGEG